MRLQAASAAVWLLVCSFPPYEPAWSVASGPIPASWLWAFPPEVGGCQVCVSQHFVGDPDGRGVSFQNQLVPPGFYVCRSERIASLPNLGKDMT